MNKLDIRRALAMLVPLTALGSLTACASIDGAPYAVITPQVMRATVKTYDYATTIRAFYGTNADRQGLSRRDYRGMVVSVYLGAIDSEYYDFRRRLAASGRGSALGLDLAVLALSGLTGIVKESARREFATAATVAGGSREAVDKNLFFERTLPSVIAAMDAERTRVKTAIQQKLDLDENRYPLASAFADIAEYQLAGTLERGTQHVATVTAADTAKAKAELERTIQGCEIIEDLAADNRRLTMALYDGQNYRTKRLNIAAGSVDVPLEASDEDTYDALIAYLDDQDCRAADRKGAVDRILAAIEKSESDAAPSEAHE